ncbi:MAG: NAD(P)H-quinone oxidoreductase subunit H [Desulfovibrio sp.]
MHKPLIKDMQGDFYTCHFEKGAQEDSLILNMGPQHPSTHGVLRILCEMDGEYVLRAEPVLGYLHRMHDKMGEIKSPAQFISNMGRVDYLNPMAWNWAFVGAAEKIMGLEVSERCEYARVIAAELSRISSHLVGWGAWILDLGATTPILYAFDDREYILDIIQEMCGSRLTNAYFRVGGVCKDITPRAVQMIREFIPAMRARIPMYHALVSKNMILRGRIEGVGIIDRDMCNRYGCTGPVARGAGIHQDTRRSEPHSVYPKLDFKVPVYDEACSMSRYLIRLDEIEQSLTILEQCIEMMPAEGAVLPPKNIKFSTKLPAGEAYFATEGGRGKVGIWIASDGGKYPYRVKLRAPGFSNLSCFAEVAKGMLLADAIAVLGSLDLVIPEVDR